MPSRKKLFQWFRTESGKNWSSPKQYNKHIKNNLNSCCEKPLGVAIYKILNSEDNVENLYKGT